MHHVHTIALITVAMIYATIIALIVSRAYYQTKNNSDYLLGSRQLGPVVAALGAGASDMSGWLMMALPGAVYTSGLNQLWLPIGLTLGAYCNWKLVAPKLRVITEKLDAETIPSYLERRFRDHSGIIRLITATIFLIFFTVYAAAGFVSLAIQMKMILPLSYYQSLLIAWLFIVFYTSIGGYLAVNWVDVFQGSLMFLVLLVMPIVTYYAISTDTMTTFHQISAPGFFSITQDTTWIGVISLLAWGLGYAGQPHILVRFMGARSEKDIHIGRRICLSWMTLSLIGAVGVGITGSIYFLKQPLGNPETVFIQLIQNLLNPWMASVFMMAIMSSIVSTLAAQLLITSSAFAQDICAHFNIHASKHNEVSFQRLSVMGVAFCALLLSLDPNSRILSLVGIAWAGLGAAFAPVIICSLHIPSMSKKSALLGMLTGSCVVLLWIATRYILPDYALFQLYELVPAFFASLIAILACNTYEKQLLAQAI